MPTGVFCEKSMTTTDTSASRLAALKAECRTLDQLVPFRAKTHPTVTALRQYNRAESRWVDISYAELNDLITTWRKALAACQFSRGSRVAILLNNSVNAVLADQCVLADALIPVPLHAIDTPASSAYIAGDSEAVCLFTNKKERWEAIRQSGVPLPHLRMVVLTEETQDAETADGVEVIGLAAWLKRGETVTELPESPREEDLAAIVYTSGTTGRPKGVMLTHKNVLFDAVACCEHIAPQPMAGGVFLSFLPLSHTFERTAGYYLALGMACTIVYNRSIMLLNEDLQIVKPTVLISVPRVYERIYARINDKLKKAPGYARCLFEACVSVGWRNFCRKNKLPVEPSVWSVFDGITGPILNKLVAKKILEQFGGRLQLCITGGAALSPKVARMFGGLGLAPVQGYGMTEASPVIGGNWLGMNQPDTVGRPLPGMHWRLDPETKEIQVSGPSVMKGYWKRPEDTAKVFTEDGWLKTGDVGEINEAGLLRIRGRIKEIIVTSTGEKVPPVDLELALETDPLFAQTYVVGDDQPFISFITVLDATEWKKLADSLKLDPENPESLKSNAVKAALLKRAKAAASDFPHYALPRNVTAVLEPWTIDNGYLTPTLKLKRGPLKAHFAAEIDAMYAGHNR